MEIIDAAGRQSPHAEDEVYVVTAGRGRFTSGGQTVDVAPQPATKHG